MLTESQLDRINRIRKSAGRNLVTMQTAQLMMDVMSDDERRSILLRISGPAIEDVIGNVDKAVRFVRSAVAAERERCAKVAEVSSCVYPDRLRNEGFNLARDFIAAKIREGNS